MLPIIHWLELAAGCGLVALGFSYSDRASRIPYTVYFLFYILTSFIGGLIIFFLQNNIPLWNAIFIGMDSDALPSPLPERYFQLLVMPLLVVPMIVIVLRWIFPVSRSMNVATVQVDQDEISAIVLVASASLLLCIVDMVRGGVALTGYLSSAVDFIDYTGKMLARTTAFSSMKIVSISIIYTILPMFAAALSTSIKSLSITPSRQRAVLVIVIFLVFIDLYLCTVIYIKSQIIITLIYILIAMSLVKRIRFRHIAGAGVAGVLVLGVLYYFLSFAGGPIQGVVAARLAVLTAFYQVFFRMAVGLPFAASLFPDVQPYAGLDFGLGPFGISPHFATNAVVFNYMRPLADPAVQGLQPVPAHFSAYAGGGMVPALIWLVFIGIFIFLIGRFGRGVRTALGAGMFAVWCIYLYYAAQGDLLGGFWASYGPFWSILFYIACWCVKAVIGALRQRSRSEGDGESISCT